MGQSSRGPSLPEHNRVHLAPTVVVASRYGTLWALDARYGHLLWHTLPTSELTEVVASP